MNRSWKALMAIAALALFALPAVANAGMKDVKQHVRKADSYLDKAESLVERNRDGRAAKKMDRANREAKRAHRDAKRMDGVRSARGEKKAAAQFDENAASFVESIGDVRNRVQDDVAEEIGDAVEGRERALSKLTELLEQVPEQAVNGLTRAIAAISGDSGSELEELTAAVENGEIGKRSLDEVLAAIETVEQAIAEGVARLEGLIATLPPQAQQHVQGALDQIRGGPRRPPRHRR